MKRIESETEDQDLSPEMSNINELMSVSKPFTSGQYIRDIINSVKSGEINPLAAMTVVKRFEKVAKKVLEDQQFKDLATVEAEKHLAGGTKSFQLYSATISRGATYTSYDFSECGHPILNELYNIQKEIEEAIKKYEDELKLLVTDNPKTDELGISSNTKEIVVDRIPILNWERNEDQVRVTAPLKLQKIGIKFMKV